MLLSRRIGAPFSFTAHAHDIFLEDHLLAWKLGTARFAVAISERSVNNWVSQWGSSDVGWDKGYIGKFVFEDVDAWLKITPSTYATEIHNPEITEPQGGGGAPECQ